MRSHSHSGRRQKIGGCAAPVLPLPESAHQVVNKEIFLFTRWEVRGVRFEKRQDPWLQQLLPAEAEQQSAGEPRRTGELQVGWGSGGPDGNMGNACHSWNRNDASR